MMPKTGTYKLELSVVTVLQVYEYASPRFNSIPTTRTTRARYPNDRGMKRRVSPTTPPFTYFDALTVTRAELFCHQILFHALEAVHWICQANTSSPHRVKRSGRR